MKRNSVSLVSYSSSDEEGHAPDYLIRKKRSRSPKLFSANLVYTRKLPKLSSSLVPPSPDDDPKLHQGRMRTIPHVEGQFVAHVYLSCISAVNTPFHRLLDEVLRFSSKLAPTLYEIGSSHPDCKIQTEAESRNSEGDRELHISLSRPIYLRAHQREELKRAVKAVATSHRRFKASFATFSELTNDEHTRTFLTMEVGAGHIELAELSGALAPALLSIRQKEYYSTPRFHASIAWALLDPSAALPLISTTVQSPSLGSPSELIISMPDSSTSISPDVTQFPTIPRLPPQLIPMLNEKYGSRLASTKVGTFDVEEIYVKIGKETFCWRLVDA